MGNQSRTPWLSIILAGLLSFATGFVLVAGTMMVYAFGVAFQARGEPDPRKIEAFANRVIPYVGPASLALVVMLAAWWVVRRGKSARLWHGVMVGVVAVIPTLIFMRRPELSDLVRLVLPPVSGLVGALIGRSRAGEIADEPVV
jgi:hypothetical protein